VCSSGRVGVDERQRWRLRRFPGRVSIGITKMAESTTAFEGAYGFKYTREIHVIADMDIFEMAGGGRGGILAGEGGKAKPREALG
jgi:hypothetical protein